MVRGEMEAEDLFRRAGIGVSWLNCPGSQQCSEPPNPGDLILTILRKKSATRGEDVLGFAVENGGGMGTYGYVFEDSLNAVAGQTHLTTSRLLGYAIAHEVGHLLKGGHSHSPKGIMSAVWLKPELEEIARGALAFTADDGAIMCARLRQIRDEKPSAAQLEIMK